MPNADARVMADGLTPKAKVLWQAIPPHQQKQLLSSVWCTRCAKATSMQDFTGRVGKGDLVLSGCCARCGASVTRVIEAGP